MQCGGNRRRDEGVPLQQLKVDCREWGNESDDGMGNLCRMKEAQEETCETGAAGDDVGAGRGFFA